VPLRRDNHTKVYCGRSEEVMRPHARLMEEPTQIADCVTQQRRCSGPALCSDERRTWQVYHAQSRFSLRRVPHADSGQPRAAGFELAGFRDRVRRLLPRCYRLLTALLDRPQPVRLVLVGIISSRRWDQLRAFFAEMIEATAHRLALHRVRVEGKVGDCRSIEANSDSRPPSTATSTANRVSFGSCTFSVCTSTGLSL
jgi:hypothetical protein